MENWQEMQAAIIRELENKADELRERATLIDCLIERLTNGDWPDAMAEPDREPANMYGDLDKLRVLQEAHANWPHCSTAPGEGYW